jgi:hypothetical protein
MLRHLSIDPRTILCGRAISGLQPGASLTWNSEVTTSFDQLALGIERMCPSCSCEVNADPPQLRVTKGTLVLAVMKDTNVGADDRFVLVRVRPKADFLFGNLSPVSLVQKVAEATIADDGLAA